MCSHLRVPLPAVFVVAETVALFQLSRILVTREHKR